MKSRAMCDQGRLGMGRGRSRPDVGLMEVLFRAQTEQAEMNSRASLTMVGHHNHCCSKATVRFMPG